MTIYNYDDKNKELISSSIATENPLEKGKYLIPKNATTKEPLTSKSGYAICFDEELSEWNYIVDYRGQTIHDIDGKLSFKCDYLGELNEYHALGDYVKTDDEVRNELLSNYKIWYLERFNAKLQELDYDSIATVTMWANDTESQYYTESKTLLNWYKALISKHYEIVNSGETYTKEQYLALLPLFTTYEL